MSWRERAKARNRERYATDPAYREAKKASVKDHRQRNRDKINSAIRAKRSVDPESARALERARRAADPEKFRERDRRYKEKNPERVKAKARRTNLRKLYGLTLDQFDALVKRQLDRCIICEVAFVGMESSKIHVDHCHRTGRVRGVLCSACNLLIGHAREDAHTLRRAVAYIEKGFHV